MSDARSPRGPEPTVPGLAKLFSVILDAAERRGRLDPAERQLFFEAGANAAEAEISMGTMVDAYLRGAGELWEVLFDEPNTSGHSVELSRALRQISESAVTELAEGFESTQRRHIRAEETARRELIVSLLSPGPTDPVWFDHHARSADFPVARSYTVAVADCEAPLVEGGSVHGHVQRHLRHRHPGRPWTVAVAKGQLVLIAGEAEPGELESIGPVLAAEAPGNWVVGVGDRLDAIDGIATSYARASEALRLGRLFGLGPVVHHDKLLVERLLAADPSITASLVAELEPLGNERHAPLLATLGAYFDANGNMADTARVLNIGPRTVAYRLDRISELTGHSPREASGRLTLELALRSRALADPAA